MSIFRSRPLRCDCGNTFSAEVATGIDVGRTPAARTKVLDRTFHRFTCPHCSRRATAECELIYTDLARSTVIRVLPRWDMHRWEQESQRTSEAVGRLPAKQLSLRKRSVRIAFGLEELREKLIAQDAGLDDRELELVKTLAFHEHPFLLRRPRLGFYLDQVSNDRLQFVARFDHDTRRYEVTIGRPSSDESAAIRRWSARILRRDLFRAHRRGDHWINVRRFAPRQRALHLLEGYGDELGAGRRIDMASADFQFVLQYLPRGTHLPEWAKKDLRAVYDFARLEGDSRVQDLVFEIRFGIELEDDWAQNNDPDDIDTLWDLLRDLPDEHVEGNSSVAEITLSSGGGGSYDEQSHVIDIGEDLVAHPSAFENVVLHEFGHAVHSQREKLVDDWLWDRFGLWEFFGDDGIDEWVEMMGGWGNATAGQQRDVKRNLHRALGTVDWKPGTIAKAPSGHPWSKKTRFGPRRAVERSNGSKDYWYDNHKYWHRYGGYAFYLNYYYKCFSVVDEKALDLVAKMPSTYAAMSRWEFFAELYALHYDVDHPRRKHVPKNVREWLETELGEAQG